MSESDQRITRFIELAIIAREGPRTVAGVQHESTISAELARRALAERIVAEASLLRDYIVLDPECFGCAGAITAGQESQEIQGHLYHNTDDLPCAREFEDNAASYITEYHATHPDGELATSVALPRSASESPF
jgi:hypothetical protein